MREVKDGKFLIDESEHKVPAWKCSCISGRKCGNCGWEMHFEAVFDGGLFVCDNCWQEELL